jgi:hypothetical protein
MVKQAGEPVDACAVTGEHAEGHLVIAVSTLVEVIHDLVIEVDRLRQDPDPALAELRRLYREE